MQARNCQATLPGRFVPLLSPGRDPDEGRKRIWLWCIPYESFSRARLAEGRSGAELERKDNQMRGKTGTLVDDILKLGN